jgi:hypothetical protein
MSKPDRAFNQVKAILGKLDRSIDEARERRLGKDDEPKTAPEQKVGRAQPLRREGERPGASALDRWK